MAKKQKSEEKKEEKNLQQSKTSRCAAVKIYIYIELPAAQPHERLHTRRTGFRSLEVLLVLKVNYQTLKTRDNLSRKYWYISK